MQKQVKNNISIMSLFAQMKLRYFIFPRHQLNILKEIKDKMQSAYSPIKKKNKKLK